jgi:alpha-amylase/alpha-mannosidase (GH57 family)
MDRYICIHGHFYQPPRENPWLEAVELQDSAYPYHDWNERVTAECYAPNAVARILDGQGRIQNLANNYARMSFNFGPTLLSWLEVNNPEVYHCILQADAESRENFRGHGSALAQAYNHLILPLATRRDKYTQVLWGIRDFERRFQRSPEGMWLPETAVDLETLEILAELGVRFTILSPYQARRWRNVGEETWQEAEGGRIDPTRAYVQNLPSGRSINLFFYDGPIARALAFEKLLTKGEDFVARLESAFSKDRDWPQLVHIATDGETYGHHHPHGDMALAYAFQYLAEKKIAKLTNYGEYLEHHPPRQEVEILENTSWSCSHGIGRWREDCGCNSGGHPQWKQAWRKPLRDALDWLRDTLTPKYEQSAKKLLRDPWAARDQYLDVLGNRSPENVDAYLARHAAHELAAEEKSTVLKLLELQRHAMLMYTSCGWFFDDLSGIETVQILQYAGRVVQLARELFGDTVEEQFLKLLAAAKCNLSEPRDGREIYLKWIRPTAVDWARIAAHYAVSALFDPPPERSQVFCYTAECRDFQSHQAGKVRLVVGRALFRSEITRESAEMIFGVVHFGDHNVNGGVRRFVDEKTYQELAAQLVEVFAKADFAELIRVIDRGLGESTYSLRSLFRDAQRTVLKRILHGQLVEADAAYRHIYEENLGTMRFLAELGIPQPKAFQAALGFLLNTDVRWDLEEESPSVEHIRSLLDEAAMQRVSLDVAGVAHKLGKRLAQITDAFREDPGNPEKLKELDAMAGLARSLPFAVDMWHAQNVYFELMKSRWPEMLQRLQSGEKEAEAWLDGFLALGEKLGICIEALKKNSPRRKASPR